ncbi:hypothetical protein OIU85_008687 [Salix viminalis]|uniref:Thioredoxin-like protein 4A n=1 Tax=Salix viminalis TaxID=40686 RepID=A0A9Q0NY94_SALVM|nr:hypothetical protein OIU85_008687 [Salix viminalis]
MSYLLPHLHSGWAVDQAILAEEERLVVIRFGHDWDETCMQMDEVLASVAETIKNFAVIYLVDITEIPDFNTMYELYDPSTVMFFFRNKHIMIDLGTGDCLENIMLVSNLSFRTKRGDALVNSKYHVVILVGVDNLLVSCCGHGRHTELSNYSRIETVFIHVLDVELPQRVIDSLLKKVLMEGQCSRDKKAINLKTQQQ